MSRCVRLGLVTLLAACGCGSIPGSARLTLPAPAPPLGPVRAPALLRAETVTLANGLMLIVAPRDSLDEVRATLVLRRAGEARDMRHAAVARATFAAMRRRFEDAASDAFTARLGADANASYRREVGEGAVDADAWTWTTIAPPASLVDTLFGFARSLRSFDPTAEDADRERDAATDERAASRRPLDGYAAAAQLDRDLRELRAVLGGPAPEAADAVDAAAMAGWARARYVPRETAVVVQGPVRLDAVRALVERFFGDWQGPDAPPRAAAALGSWPIRAAIVPTPPRPRSSLTLFARTPIGTVEERAAALLLQVGMCSDLGSRVADALRGEQGAVYSVQRARLVAPDAGIACHVEVEPQRALGAAQTLFAVARDLAAHGFTPHELERARRAVVASLADAPGTATGLQDVLVAAAAAGRAPERDADPVLTAILSLDRGTVNARIAAALRPESVHLVVRGDPELVPRAELERIVGGPVAVTAPEVPRVAVAPP